MRFSKLLVIFLVCVVMVAAFPTQVSAFTMRTTAPPSSSTYYYSSANPFYSTYVGQCTWYAFGRAYEILGSKPKLCTGNAKTWYSYNQTNKYYNYGSVPKEGAIACFGSTEYGHVAVVEKVVNGTAYISEFNYGTPSKQFKYGRTISPSGEHSGLAVLQGYIYILEPYSEPTSVAANNTPDRNTIYATNAVVYGKITKPSSYSITTHGCTIWKDGSSNKTKINQTPSKDYAGHTEMISYFDVNSELNITLEPGTKYWYQVHAIVNGIEYTSTATSFTTDGTAPVITANTTPDRNKIYSTNAVIYGKVTKPSSYSITTHGCTIWKDGSSNKTRINQTPSKDYSGFTEMVSYFDVNSELNITLEPGTKYWYQIHAVVNGKEYTSTATSFLTTGTTSVTGISVKTQPSKTAYLVGESLDTSGLTLIANYSNGTSQTISSGFTVSGFSSDTAGEKTVTVKFDGKTTTFNVSVTAITLTKLTVKTQPSKTAYLVGESLDTSGLTLTANYSDGTSQTVSNGYTVSGFASDTPGEKTVTVKFDGKTATFNVSVTAATLTKLTVKTKPDKSSYYVGEILDTSGLTLTATYNNGNTSTLSSGFSCSPTKFSAAGSITVTVSYDGQSTTFPITVKDLTVTALSVTAGPKKTVYNRNEPFISDGLQLKVTYSNGTSQQISTGYKTEYDFTKGGAVTVSYGGIKTSFIVTVLDEYIESIKISSEPAKTVYYVDEPLSLDGLLISAFYSNGSSKEITSGFDAIYDFSSSGEKIVKLQYGEHEVAFSVTVEDITVESIEILSMPNKREYKAGEKFDPTGIKLKINYSNQQSAECVSGYTTIYDFSETGEGNVVIEYANKQVSLPVTVEEEDSPDTEVLQEKDTKSAKTGKVLPAIIAGASVAALTLGLVVFLKLKH